MAYDPTIPAVANTVRGATGDLVKMKENFVHLDPVATSGLHGLLSGGLSVASGQVPVTQGGAGSAWHYVGYNLNSLTNVVIAAPASGQALTYDGSDWVNATPNTTLSGLTDTVIAGPVSGEALTFDGDDWVNATPVTSLAGLSDTAVGGVASGEALIYDGSDWVASGATARPVASVLKSIDQTGIANDETWVTVTGFEDVNADPNFTAHASGIEILTALSRIDLQANVGFLSSTGAQIGSRLTLNGAPLSSGAHGIEAEMNTRDGGGSPTPRQHLVALGIPVASGDILGVQVSFSAGATTTVISGVQTNLLAQDNAQAPGGSGGGGGSSAEATAWFTFASGAVEVIGNADFRASSGITETRRNTGGFTVASGAITVPVGSGYTHVDIEAALVYEQAGGGGVREMYLMEDGSTNITDTDGVTVLAAVFDRQVPALAAGRDQAIHFSSGPLPVLGGEVFNLNVYQDSGGNLELRGGNGPEGAQSYFRIRGLTLT